MEVNDQGKKKICQYINFSLQYILMKIYCAVGKNKT